MNEKRGDKNNEWKKEDEESILNLWLIYVKSYQIALK